MVAGVVVGALLRRLRKRGVAQAVDAALAAGKTPWNTALGANSGVVAYSSHYESNGEVDWATYYLKESAPWLWGMWMRAGGWRYWQVGGDRGAQAWDRPPFIPVVW